MSLKIIALLQVALSSDYPENVLIQMIRSDMKRVLQWEPEWGNKAIAAAELRQRGYSSQVLL